jgi:hypothetical protein
MVLAEVSLLREKHNIFTVSARLKAVTHKDVVLLQFAVKAERAVHGLRIPLQLLHATVI